MNRHATNISAVFLKDLRQLWPLAALTAAAILAHTLFNYGNANLANWLTNATLFIPGIFIISLVQQDAPASLRHEWLTRPISSLDVLLAKILLAAVIILLPAIAGPVIGAARHGTSLPDTLLRAIIGMKTQMNLIGAFILLLVAAVTPTLAQAIAVLVGLVLFQMLAQPLPNHIENVWGTVVIVTLISGIVVLWLQYAQRRTIAARGAFVTMISVLTIAMALLVGSAGNAHSQTKPAPITRSAIDGILTAFQTHPLVGLGDAHGMAQEQDFYAALVRDPRFARDVGNVVVEFGNAADQDIIDRYVDGQDVPYTELRKVWTDPVGWAPPPFDLGYVNFFAQVRATNQSLPAGQRIHVWLGDPPVDWSKVQKREDIVTFASSYRDVYSSQLIEREILGKGRKSLLIFGHLHFNRDGVLQSGLHFDTSMAWLLEQRHPSALFVVLPYAGFIDKACSAEFEKDKATLLAPTLLLPVRDTTLDDAAFRQRCPAWKIDSVPSAFQDRLQRLATGVTSDAILYLGPASSLTQSPSLPDAYLDEDYRKEILRHWGIFGMRGDPSDMAFDKNPASPRPFGY